MVSTASGDSTDLRRTPRPPTHPGSPERTNSASATRPAAARALRALEYRVDQLEQLTSSQDRALRTQFERIAQLQADCDIVRIRLRNDERTSGLIPTPCETRQDIAQSRGAEIFDGQT